MTALCPACRRPLPPAPLPLPYGAILDRIRRKNDVHVDWLSERAEIPRNVVGPFLREHPVPLRYFDVIGPRITAVLASVVPGVTWADVELEARALERRRAERRGYDARRRARTTTIDTCYTPSGAGHEA